MRAKVRSIEPEADDGRLEEFSVEPGPEIDEKAAAAAPVPRIGEGPAGSTTDSTAAGGAAERRRAPAPLRVVDAHRIVAADLGPNGDVVFALLERARALTLDECRKLEEEAAWRWWSVTPLPGATMPGARATALVRGRADGRADAIVALEAGVQSIVGEAGPTGVRRGSRVTASIANAGLAVLVRDLIEPETFETLFGPWRQVMHH